MDLVYDQSGQSVLLKDVQHLCHGLALGDGSCTRHVIPQCSRASWAVAFYDSERDDPCQPKVVLVGPVWAPLPQTPQAGEHVAAAATVMAVSGPTRFIGDSLGVLRVARSTQAHQLSARIRYAGVRQSALSAPGSKHISSYEHVKAHQTDQQISQLPPAQAFLARANNFVDAPISVCTFMP